tara:strand:- start:507 stop:935 length:429 start_codon:yes stop_codon:yes gene_type:complete
MAIKFNQVILNKLQKNKTDLSKKVDLSLYDGLQYDFNSLQDEVSRLSYSTEEYFDEKFEEFYQLRSDLRSVYFQNSEAFISSDDVSNDLEILNDIIAKSEELGIDPTEVDANIFEQIKLIEDLKYYEERFESQKRELENLGL